MTDFATVYRMQMIRLIEQVAHTVAPGSPVTTKLDDDFPVDCESPKQGLEYYSVNRDFEAPEGHTGASLIPAIATALEAHGYHVDPPDTVGGWAEVGISDGHIDLSAMGDPDSRSIRINVDTRCGRKGGHIVPTTEAGADGP